MARTLLGRVNLDARTATDWGLLRTFVQLDIRRRTGAWYGSGTSMRQGFGVGYGGGVNPNGGFPSYGGVNSYSATGGIQLESSVNVDKAFIQWGGLTAGRFQSFFDFYADNDNYHGMGGSDVTTEGLAYTYTFGNGFSATLAIEDGIERRNVVASVGTVAEGNIFPSVFASAAFANYAITFPAIANPIFASQVAFPGAFSSFDTGQRQNTPDVVGALRVDQGLGLGPVVRRLAPCEHARLRHQQHGPGRGQLWRWHCRGRLRRLTERTAGPSRAA